MYRQSVASRPNKAFTIIEVVLVLAVAGLIFLVVFAAIPRLQASRRDNQRKRDAEALFASVIDFQANVGRLPTNTEVVDAMDGSPGGVFADYLPSTPFEGPEGTAYQRVATWNEYNANPSSVVFGQNAIICNGTGTSSATGSSGEFSVFMSLERGSFCIDNAS